MIDVDHILPDRWYEHWPLNGETITQEQVSSAFLATLGAKEESPRMEAIMRREKLKATFGNLTLLHYGVNRSLQNGAFAVKRERFFAESNLHLNRHLMLAEDWDESSIERRGAEMFELAKQIWKGP